MNRKRRQNRLDGSRNDPVGLHDVRLILASGPYRMGCGCLACMLLLTLICVGAAGVFVFAGLNDSPVFYFGAILFAAASAFFLFMAYNHWQASDRSGLEAAVVRVSGPATLAGQSLTLHIAQSKRQPICVKAMTIQLFIGKLSKQPDSRRGWKFKPNSINYVDSLGKLHRDQVPFLTQSISDSSDMEPVELTLRIDVPRIDNRNEQDCKWGLRLTTTTVGDLPACHGKYYLPDPVPKRVVAGPVPQTCVDCKNKYTKAVEQDETYTELSGPIPDGPSGDKDFPANPQATAHYYQIHRCPHCGAIVKKKRTHSRRI